MKKFVALLIAVITLGFASCSQHSEPLPTDETSTSTAPISATVETTIPLISPDQLPKPNEIKLRDQSMYWEDDQKYRSVYYGFSGFIGDLGKFVPIHGDKKDEMELANFVKANNIKKEDFIAAVQKDYEFLLLRGEDIYYEGNELPNADIIYTFDNEIINAYYRRENPVVPEEYRTYDSYEEYLKANPE